MPSAKTVCPWQTVRTEVNGTERNGKNGMKNGTERKWELFFDAYCTLFSRVKGHKGSPVLPRLLPSIVMGSLLRRAHFESLRAAEAKNAATINQLKYRSRSCIAGNIALGAWSRANKALGCASCFIGSRPRPRAIFLVMHSHGTLTSIYFR